MVQEKGRHLFGCQRQSETRQQLDPFLLSVIAVLAESPLVLIKNPESAQSKAEARLSKKDSESETSSIP